MSRERMDWCLVWFSKLVSFLAAIVWVVGFLWVGLIFSEGLPEILKYLEVIPQDAEDTVTVAFLQNWARVTVVILGMTVAMVGYRFIGKWKTLKTSISEEKLDG